MKDYLARESRKRSGWAAIKSVAKWNRRMFELQIQPLHNFLSEREALTRESHAAFKTNRDKVRGDVAARIPLFGFYLRLMHWLFVDHRSTPPAHPGVRVTMRD